MAYDAEYSKFSEQKKNERNFLLPLAYLEPQGKFTLMFLLLLKILKLWYFQHKRHNAHKIRIFLV